MRIITPGKPKTPLPEHQTMCPECSCKFAFTEQDVRKETITTPPEARVRVVAVKCPQVGCGFELGVRLP